MYFTPTLHSVCCINVKGKAGIHSAFAAESDFSDQCLEGKKKKVYLSNYTERKRSKRDEK